MKRYIFFTLFLLCCLSACGDAKQNSQESVTHTSETVSFIEIESEVPSTETNTAEGSNTASEITTEESDAESYDASEITTGESVAESSDANDVSDEESADYTEGMTLEVKVEIYKENTQELITSFVLTDPEICVDIFTTFDTCFAELCEKYPHDAAPDKDVKTDYRVAVYLNTYFDTAKEDLAYYIDISYPYGYTNDIYRLMHHGGSPFGSYVARCGKEFIDKVDAYAKQYIPQN